MTKVGKFSKMLLTLTLIVLAFCCSFGVTNSYFTASSSKSGNVEFEKLDVKFKAVNEQDAVLDESSTITLYPMTGAIIRGEAFNLSLTETNQTAIGNIKIANTEESIEAYVRFWIDAFIVDESKPEGVDTTTNYGQYFLLNYDADYVSKGGAKNLTVATESDWCYYLQYELVHEGAELGDSSLNIGNTLTLSETVTDETFSELVGHQLRISITLEAVQRANGAVRFEFNDEKGYYTGWN